MSTLPSSPSSTLSRPVSSRSHDRRRHRRHELAGGSQARPVDVHRADTDLHGVVGRLVDLSAGGVRITTADATLKPGTCVGVRLALPEHAGISPFVRLTDGEPEPSREWTGTFEIARRIERADGTYDLGGRFVDMTPVDRGMLGLYLSIQPLAA